MGFCQEEYWSGLPFPPPGGLPNLGIEPASLVCPALADGVLTTMPAEKCCPLIIYILSCELPETVMEVVLISDFLLH